MSVVRILSEIADKGLAAWASKPFLERVVGVVPGVIYVFNQKTQSIEYTNRSMEELMGYSGEDIQVFGDTPFPKLCHPEDLSNIEAHFAALQSMQDGEVASVEYRMRRKDGHWVWLLSHDTVFERHEDGSILRHIGIATDIGPQKAAEEQAIAAQHLAEAVNQELRAFSYAVSHELRAPAVTLEMLLTEIRDGHTGALNAETLALIEQSLGTVQRMHETVEGTLAFTKVVEDPVTLAQVDLGTLVGQVIDDLRAEIAAAKAQVTIGALPQVFGDPAQLRIVFSNLVANAIKYTAPDRPTRVSIEAQDAGRGETETILVSDTGIGIDPKDADNIFRLYWRGHSDGRYAGMGLGLALCRRVVLAHGGRISVAPRPGGGSQFSVTLPSPPA